MITTRMRIWLSITLQHNGWNDFEVDKSAKGDLARQLKLQSAIKLPPHKILKKKKISPPQLQCLPSGLQPSPAEIVLS